MQTKGKTKIRKAKLPRIDWKNGYIAAYKCRICGNIFEEELGKYGCCDSPARPLWKPIENKPNINPKTHL